MGGPRHRRDSARRIRIVALDQAVSGGSNLLASIIAARTLDPRSFGVFSMIFLVYTLFQAGSRSVVSNPVLVEPQAARERLGAVIGSGWLFGLGSAALTLVVAGGVSLVDRPMAVALAILGVCTPLLNMQDIGRFLGIGLQRATVALWLDLIWLVLLLAVVAVFQVAGIAGIGPMTAAWAGSGALAGLYSLWAWRAPGSRPSARWLVSSWHLSWRFAVTFSAIQAGLLAIAGLVRAMFGAVTLGALLGGQIFMRPYNMLETALVSATVSEIAHHRDDLRFVARHARKVTIGAVTVAALNGAVILVLPDWAGRMLLGQTWPHAKQFLPAYAVLLLAIGLSIGARAGLVGLRAVKRAMTLSVCFMGLLVVLVYVGALLGGPVACAWGLAAGWFAAAVAWWTAFVQLGRKLRSGPVPSSA